MTHREPPESRAVPPASGSHRRAFPILVLMIALICGAVVTGKLWQVGAATDRDLAAHRHRVTATTTGPAEDPPATTRYGTKPYSLAPATWEQPAHVRHSGTVHVPPRTPRGQDVSVWVDDAGFPVRPPGDTADRALAAFSGGVTAAGVAGLAGAGTLVLVRRTAEGRRYAAWEREWERVEPVWSGRDHRGSGAGTDHD
ncbi:hypothetical protein [Streptomyces sp. NPDC086147]|uniref:Rv1733c family protein n=1 Tax=Streptomyces sp. NPDC086147 TaxID=3155295 RepID=UPI00344E3820